MTLILRLDQIEELVVGLDQKARTAIVSSHMQLCEDLSAMTINAAKRPAETDVYEAIGDSPRVGETALDVCNRVRDRCVAMRRREAHGIERLRQAFLIQADSVTIISAVEDAIAFLQLREDQWRTTLEAMCESVTRATTNNPAKAKPADGE